MKYQIFNVRTQQNIGKPLINKKRARNKAEMLNLEYGAHSYIVRYINEDGSIFI